MSKHSSDLLNVSGKKKSIDNVVNVQAESDDNDAMDIFPTPSGKNKTFPVGGSGILSRVQAFLPQLKNANEQLKNADPKNLDIENVDEENGQYIEMNLGLGVYEEKKPDDSSDSEEEESEDEKLIIPNSNAPADKSKKPLIEFVEK